MANETAIREAIESVPTGYVVGLRVEDDETVAVGDALMRSRSYDCETQEPTGEVLWGTSAIAVMGMSVGEILDALAPYSGRRLLVVYGVDSLAGEDEGEVLIRDARVAATYAR